MEEKIWKDRVFKKDSRRCTAKNRSGERCRKSPLRYQAVCEMHGGRAPQNLAAAKTRMMEALEPAVETLHRIFEDPFAGYNEKLKATKMVLNRSGLGPVINIKAAGPSEIETELYDLTDEELGERASEIAERVKSRINSRINDVSLPNLLSTNGGKSNSLEK